tara:strand:- start:579 stop:791 length:213 start_codon:yes stop_codon:yes gene_type:complete
MLKISQAQVQGIMYRLRCTAEKDPNDVIANAASQLAFELELPRRIHRLDDKDRALIDYANAKKYSPTRPI